MRKYPKLVPFTNALGITMMVFDTAPAVEPEEDTLPIDHVRWVYAIGALSAAAVQIVAPVLLCLN